MLGKVLGPKTEVTMDWRRLHKEVLHDVYSSPNNLQVIKPKRMRLGGGGRACGVSVLVGKSEVLRPIGRPGHKGG